MAAEHLPSPLAAAPERYARLLPPRPEQLKAAAAAEGGAGLAASLDAVEGAVHSGAVTAQALGVQGAQPAEPAQAFEAQSAEEGMQRMSEQFRQMGAEIYH